MYRFIKAFKNSKISSGLATLRDIPESAAIFADPIIQRMHLNKFKSDEELHDSYDTLDIVSRKHILSGLNYLLDHIQELQSLVFKTYDMDTSESDLIGWTLVCDSSILSNTTGYYGQIWINHRYKQVAIVSSGTKLNFPSFPDSSISNLYGILHLLKDGLNDIQVFMHCTPSQYKRGMERFIEYFISLDLDLKEYDITFTGHSLGAILSDLGALYAHKYKTCFNSIHSITTENPGSKTSMETLYQKLSTRGELEGVDLEELRSVFYVLNNRPNWVNTNSEQFGEVYLNEPVYTKVPVPTSVSDILPTEISEVLRTALDHIEWHDKGYFKGMRRISYVEKWEVGLFQEYVREKSKLIYDYAVLSRYKSLSGIISSVAEIASKTIISAGESLETAKSYLEDARTSIFGGDEEGDSEFPFFLTPYDFEVEPE
jgi:hypothetical protein